MIENDPKPSSSNKPENVRKKNPKAESVQKETQHPALAAETASTTRSKDIKGGKTPRPAQPENDSKALSPSAQDKPSKPKPKRYSENAVRTAYQKLMQEVGDHENAIQLVANACNRSLQEVKDIVGLPAAQRAEKQETTPAEDATKRLPDVPVHSNNREALVKYGMAQLAIQDHDRGLAHRFLAQALKLDPENSSLHYHFARFLAEEGYGRQALMLLAKVRGDLELLAKAEYLKAKIKVAAEFDGHYPEATKVARSADGHVSKLPPAGDLVIDHGVVKWRQKVGALTITQTFTFPVHGLRSKQEQYEQDLTWRSMDEEAKTYTPDRREVRLTAKKAPKGWWIELKTMDDSGNSGITTFKTSENKPGS